MPSPSDDRHLVLVGGGHAHVEVLRSFAQQPPSGLRLSIVSAHRHSVYSGMVPGYLAGQYALHAAQIDVAALAQRAGASFLADRVVGVDPARRSLRLAANPPVAYDLVSFDIGSRPSGTEVVESAAPALAVKPIEAAAAGIAAALDAPPPPAGRRAVVVGAGPGGVEIAFALAARLRPPDAVSICDRAAGPATERGARTSRAVAAAFAARDIRFVGNADVTKVDARGVSLADGRFLPATLVVWATGAGAPPLFADSGLPVDARGFLRVGDDLRSPDDPRLFAAGDCATLIASPELPKAGVYAVRQGPILAANLRRAARGEPLQPFRPQRRFLSLLNCGDGHAILSYGPIAWEGRLPWLLKDYIDRRFVRRYS